MTPDEAPVLPPDEGLSAQHVIADRKGRLFTANWDATARVWHVDDRYGTGETPATLALLGFRYSSGVLDLGDHE